MEPTELEVDFLTSSLTERSISETFDHKLPHTVNVYDLPNSLKYSLRREHFSLAKSLNYTE